MRSNDNYARQKDDVELRPGIKQMKWQQLLQRTWNGSDSESESASLVVHGGNNTKNLRPNSGKERKRNLAKNKSAKLSPPVNIKPTVSIHEDLNVYL